jgi:hypothetical protein
MPHPLLITSGGTRILRRVPHSDLEEQVMSLRLAAILLRFSEGRMW